MAEKILVIEGDKTFADKLSQELGKAGYEVTTVNDGNEGLQAIVDTLPHLVVLDVVLPNTDGYEILTKKHAEPLLAKIPVYLMSTQGVPINMHKVPQGSVTEYVLMFQQDPSEVVKLVNKRFNKKGATVPAPETNEADKKTLLWVEDDKLIGTILAKKFVSSGFNLLHAKNGDEAMSLLRDVVPHAVVLDLLLPGMDGMEILTKIRADGRLKDVPVMILSNLSKPSDLERAKALGAKKFLIKAATSLDQIVAEVNSIAG